MTVLILLTIAAVLTRRANEVLHDWPTVEAEVVESELYERRNALVYRSSDTVTFRYDVGGETYTTSEALGRSSKSAKEREEMGEKYAPGTRHEIRHDPDDPATIRFEVQASIGFYLAPVILGGLGVLFLAATVITFLLFGRHGSS